MTLSSTAQQAQMIVESGKSMSRKLKMMKINQNVLKILVEQIVYLDSFNKNEFNLWSYFIVQKCSSFLDMLNVPTYPHLVRYFFVRAEIVYEYDAFVELSLLIQNESSLKGKSKK